MSHRQTLEKTFRFEASHRIPAHKGKCRVLHGHSFKLRVQVTGPVQHDGMVMDYAVLTRIVKPLVDFLDHKHLNWFINNPTSERVAQLIARTLAPLVRDFHYAVDLSETESTMCYGSFIQTEDHVANLLSEDELLEPVFDESASSRAQAVKYAELNWGTETAGELIGLQTNFRHVLAEVHKHATMWDD